MHWRCFSWSGLTIALLIMAAAVSAEAAIITLRDPFHFTDRFGAHSFPTLPIGDSVYLGATVFSSDPPVTVIAFQGGAPFITLDRQDPQMEDVYSKWTTFFPGETGSWTIQATDGGGSPENVITPPILEPEFLPLVFDIVVLGTSDIPLLQWSVPDLTGFDVDQTTIRVIEDPTGLQVYQTTLSGTPDQFLVPAGFLRFGAAYVFRISLEDLEFRDPVFPVYPDHVENRSNAFSDSFTPNPVPEPGTLTLLVTALVATTVTGLRKKAK